MSEQLLKSFAVLLLLFKSDVPVDLDKTSQFYFGHLLESTPAIHVGAFDSMHRDAAWTEDPLDFRKHSVFIFKCYVAQDVEAHHVAFEDKDAVLSEIKRVLRPGGV